MVLNGYTLAMVPNEESDSIVESDREAVRKRFGERLMPELLKRVVDAGVVKLSEQPENLRHFVQELRVPKEVGSYLISQIDETKTGLYRAVASEIRDFLEHTNLAEELTRVLTKLSFEIRMSIRFVPNDPPDRAFPKPQVQSDVAVKEITKRKKAARSASRSPKK